MALSSHSISSPVCVALDGRKKVLFFLPVKTEYDAKNWMSACAESTAQS